MSQNRKAQLNERRSQLDLQINLLAEQENTVQLRLLRLLCERARIDAKAPEEAALTQRTKPEAIIDQLSEAADDDPSRSTA